MSSHLNIRNTVLTALADGHFHSGEKLAEMLGVTRSAVSNHVKALQNLGLDIYRVTGKGYKLAHPLTLLNAQGINDGVGGNASLFSVIDSTNQYIRDNANQLAQGAVCLAEAQTAGRGRLGRKWHSPFAANLYMSLLWHFNSGYQALDGLSLVVGLTVAKAIEQLFNVDIQLKWPNDILCMNKKLGGVLIEVEGQFGGACQTTIGIGLNIHMPEQADIGQPWIDLHQIVNGDIDRNRLAIVLVNNLRADLAHFETSGLVPFAEQWNERNAFRNKPVKLIQGKQELKGMCLGIDNRGGLVLEQDGSAQAFYGGEISVRPQ